MGMDITEYIDEYVENNYGHTNWGYASTYSEYELNNYEDYDLELDGSIVIWYSGLEEE